MNKIKKINKNNKIKGKKARKEKTNKKIKKSLKIKFTKNSLKLKLLNKNLPIKANHEKFNDFELNELNYLDALKIDKRTCSQIYISLLKLRHILIFHFVN